MNVSLLYPSSFAQTSIQPTHMKITHSRVRAREMLLECEYFCIIPFLHTAFTITTSMKKALVLYPKPKPTMRRKSIYIFIYNNCENSFPGRLSSLFLYFDVYEPFYFSFFYYCINFMYISFTFFVLNLRIFNLYFFLFYFREF